MSECRCVELSTVVIDQHSGNTKFVEDVLLDEVFHLFLCDRCQWFGLRPLDEVVDRNHGESDLALGCG